MRLPNAVRAAKCSERWIGLRSPVNWAKPTTSDDDTVFSSVSVIPTERSSKNSVRSGGKFMPLSRSDELSILRWRRGSGTARIVLVRHALLDERRPRSALELLIVGAELAGCRLVLSVDGKRRRVRQHHGQRYGNDGKAKH